MHYHCTRDSQQTVSAAQAIAQGISENGGLFVPESFPQYTHADLEVMAGCTYQERAVKILGDFLTDFSKEEIEDCVAQAYAPEKFSGAGIFFQKVQSEKRASLPNYISFLRNLRVFFPMDKLPAAPIEARKILV